MAACAYHSTDLSFNPHGRAKPYYTLADFFIQAPGEPPVTGEIWYQIHHDNWRARPGRAATGLGWQARKKRPGGRWTNYDSRVGRSTAYLGINRVVPEYEERVLRTYHRMFAKGSRTGWESAVSQSVGAVLGRQYADLDYLAYRVHKLPVLQTAAHRYSGFNMGAGESALIELFATVYACGEPLLLVIDEIELGLHEEAQVRLLHELKRISKQRRLQVLCTTHSGAVLRALPPEARVFLEASAPGSVKVLQGVSSEYATGRLSGRPNPELDVLVEDDVAQAVLLAALPREVRHRVRIVPVGSHTAVMRHLAFRAAERTDRAACAFLDGDQQPAAQQARAQFVQSFEVRGQTQDAAREAWLAKRLFFLPGPSWPEIWLLDALLTPSAEALDAEYGLTAADRRRAYDRARAAGKHREFESLAVDFSVDPNLLLHRVASVAVSAAPAARQDITNSISECLKAGITWPA